VAAGTVVVALFLCRASCASVASPAPLTSLSAIHKLTNAEASMAAPVAFEATVTYFRGYEKTLFVEDGDDAIYVLATTNLELQPGDRVLIHGFTRDSFRPIIMSNDITLLHHGAVPKPAPAEFTPLMESKLDCRYVAVRGTVLSAAPGLSTGRPVTLLELAMGKGTIGITVDKGIPARLSDLLDAEVEIHGAEAGRFDGKMQQTGILIHVTSFDDVHVLRKPPIDAWSAPLTPMDNVLDSYDVENHTPRVRVAGIVTYFQAGRMAVLQNGSRSIRVMTKTIEDVSIGQRAEAIGVPFVDDDGFMTLKWSDLRTAGVAAPITPVLVNWDQVASGRHALDLVSIEGKVVSQVREHARDVYIIAADDHLFSAAIRFPLVFLADGPKQPPPMPMIPVGSKVRVTGVVMHDDANPFNGPMAFGILLRSSSDVVVLASPSWLNVRNLTVTVSVLLVLMAMVSAWVLLLRRKVHRQTAELAAQKEAEAALERKRSRILEDINGNKPLDKILYEVTEFVAFRLEGASCWCEVGDGARFGANSAETQGKSVVCQEIPSRSGPLHGMLFAAIDPQAPCSTHAQEALAMGAWLATLAVETRGLYTDLVHRSEFDQLTDVFNRFSFERRLASVVEEAQQNGAIFGLIYIDLDDFKLVNDRYGHAAGDQYLRQASLRMKRQLRPTDTLARLGGDEFAVVVANVHSLNDVEEVSRRLDRCFHEPFAIDGSMISGSVSMGAALYPEDGSTKDSLLNAADAAMYVSKKIKKENCQQPAPK
jgi:diguanylate cyclase (GGDEF)-like protein